MRVSSGRRRCGSKGLRRSVNRSSSSPRRAAPVSLSLPRDSRVLRGQPAEAILEALIGVNLAPADLQAILTGCVVPDPMPTAAGMHANGWASIDLQGGARLYLRRTSQWEAPRRTARRLAARIHDRSVALSGIRAAHVGLAEDSRGPDRRASPSSRPMSICDPAAFRVDVPPDAQAADARRSCASPGRSERDERDLPSSSCSGFVAGVRRRCRPAHARRRRDAGVRLHRRELVSARSAGVHAGADLSRRRPLREHRTATASRVFGRSARDRRGPSAISTSMGATSPRG